MAAPMDLWNAAKDATSGYSNRNLRWDEATQQLTVSVNPDDSDRFVTTASSESDLSDFPSPSELAADAEESAKPDDAVTVDDDASRTEVAKAGGAEDEGLDSIVYYDPSEVPADEKDEAKILVEDGKKIPYNEYVEEYGHQKWVDSSMNTTPLEDLVNLIKNRPVLAGAVVIAVVWVIQ